MLQLDINNSVCKLSGLTTEQLADLKDILSYNVDPQAAFFSGNHRSTKRYLIDNKGNFPTGLLPLVKTYLDDKDYINVDKRVVPASLKLFNLKLDLTPYPEQIDAVVACLRANRGTISACTGFGKSITIAMLINALQVKTLIIVPNLELKQQLKETLTKYFGTLHNITIENIDSANLKTAEQYDLLIIDEAHHVAAKTYRMLNKKYWNNIYYRFFFTATPFRNKDEEQMLFESVAGQVIYRVTYKDAVAKGYVVPVEAYYIELPKKKIVEGYTWAQVYAELVVNNDERNNIIGDLLIKLNYDRISSLCLVKEIEHGNKVLEYALECADYNTIRYISGITNNNKNIIDCFNIEFIYTLIGTVGVLGEGVDTKPAEYVIIAGLGKSKNQFMQCVGRAVRTYPGKTSAKVIIFKDNSHKWTKSHFKIQCKILKEEYGTVAVKLEV